MANLKLSNCVRFFLQAIAVVVGLAGLCFAVVMPIRVIITTIRVFSNGELLWWGFILSFVGFTAVFLIGAYLVFVSYLVLAKFSDDAIKHLCLLLAILLFGFFSRIPEYLVGDNPDTSFLGDLYGLAIALTPLFLAAGFYRICTKVFIKLTGVPSSNDAE